MKFFRGILVISLVLSASLTPAIGEEKFPENWRKKMVENPETNYSLKKYSSMPKDKDQASIKKAELIFILSSQCQGAALNRPVVDAFLRRAGLTHPTPALQEASNIAMMDFNGFDYQSLANLCGGSDYLFGPRGVLVPGAVQKGAGEPKFPYDEANPYFVMEPFFKK